MKTFIANKVDNGAIVLSSGEVLEELYKTIENGENFIIEWIEDNKKKSKVIIGTDIISNVKTGDMVLSSEEQFIK